MAMHWWAWWVRHNPVSGNLEKFIRGPKSDLGELNSEVQQMWQGPYEVEQLDTRDPARARSILNDRMALSEGNIDIAIRRFKHRRPEHE